MCFSTACGCRLLSRIELPLLQALLMGIRLRGCSRCHLDLVNLSILLRCLGTDFLVLLRVGLLAVPRAVRDAFAHDAGLQELGFLLVCICRRLELAAIPA